VQVSAEEGAAGLASATVDVLDMPISGLSATNDSPTILGSLTTLTAIISEGTNVVFAWDLGDGDTDSGAVVDHIYPSVGMYTATVTATNSTGFDVTTTVITIIPEPVEVDFFASPTVGLVPLSVVFTNTSTGDFTTNLWRFGDGITSTLEHPQHIYENAGVFTVSLTVSGPGGTDTLTRTNYIAVNEHEPVADFSAIPIEGTVPLLVQFADQSIGIVDTWSWNFGDGATSNEQNPSHLYTSIGTYTVTLIVSGPGGTDSRTRTDYIVVKHHYIFLPLIIDET